MEELEKKIASGESFVCPAHKCFLCKQVENSKVYDMHFAVCRRRPKSYHRKCLPREITFENDAVKKILQRAWDDLLPKRILIYCLDHVIIPQLGTPPRNHICFPSTGKEKKRVSEPLLTRVDVLQKKRKPIPCHPSAEGVWKTAKQAVKGVWKTAKQALKVDFSSRKNGSGKLVGRGICRDGSDAKRTSSFNNLASASRGPKKIFSKAYNSSQVTMGKPLLKNSEASSKEYLKSYSARPGSVNISCKKLNTVDLAPPLIKKKGCSSPVVDLEMKRRIIVLMEDANSSFNMDEFRKKLKVPSTYKNSEDTLDKNLTKGKVELAVKAVQTALQTLNNGGTIDDAKAVCSPEVLRRIPLWKRKLEIFLGPFLHGMRYQSYGRHFTKMEKLQEVVDRLYWYVQDGDMIVDFCCGANDFSCLMKEKLDSAGKKCSFKNYDLFPSKNDFNFEQRDWFSVEPGELPAGSKLVNISCLIPGLMARSMI